MIPAAKIHIDPRVRTKCIVPKCISYNTCVHCPPHSLDTATSRELVSAFRYALLVKLDIPAEVTTGPTIKLETDASGTKVLSETLKKLMKEYRKVNEIVTRLESDAFYDGHYNAAAFAAGSCSGYLCAFQGCQVLQGPGMGCRFPFVSRPSMESCSMDVFRIVTEAGWEIYPIGYACNPANIPHSMLVGAILIE